MKYTYIKSKDELLAYLKRFEDVKHQVIALDIEAELNRHAYGERLCLIQIFDGVNKVLIDPFEIDNHTLRILFENKNILKVIYDASSDSSLMKNAYAIEIKSILDLRPAVDILNYEKKDLHSVIAADADGDGDLDVLSATDLDVQIAWYENRGTLVFADGFDSDGDTGCWSATVP